MRSNRFPVPEVKNTITHETTEVSALLYEDDPSICMLTDRNINICKNQNLNYFDSWEAKPLRKKINKKVDQSQNNQTSVSQRQRLEQPDILLDSNFNQLSVGAALKLKSPEIESKKGNLNLIKMKDEAKSSPTSFRISSPLKNQFSFKKTHKNHQNPVHWGGKDVAYRYAICHRQRWYNPHF